MQGEGRPGIGPVDQFSPERAEPRLDRRVREGRVDGVHCPAVVCLQTMRGREAFEAVNNGNQDVFDAAIAQIVHHREPEFGPFIIGNPQPQNLAFAFRGDTQGHVNGFVFDLTAFHWSAGECQHSPRGRVADFDPERVEKNNRIHRFQSAVLPVRDLLQNGISDTTDKIG